MYQMVLPLAYLPRVECMIPLVLGCKQVVLVGDHQVCTCGSVYVDRTG